MQSIYVNHRERLQLFFLLCLVCQRQDPCCDSRSLRCKWGHRDIPCAWLWRNFGIVCCNPAPSDLLYDCAYDAQFYITGVNTPNEWIHQGNGNNDGAVMRVSPSPNTNPGFGVALPTGSISAEPCIERDILWGGFQSKSDLQQDCGKLYSDKYLYRSSRAQEVPASCPPHNSGNVLFFPGSNCPGMSGGRLLG